MFAEVTDANRLARMERRNLTAPHPPVLVIACIAPLVRPMRCTGSMTGVAVLLNSAA
jgi:hypothetical protein